MQNVTFNDALLKQSKSSRRENRDWTDYGTSIALTAGSGLLFVLLGFFLQVVFTLFARNNSALNYAEVGSLIIAFIFFAFSAHFMDKSEENERQQKGAKFEGK